MSTSSLNGKRQQGRKVHNTTNITKRQAFSSAQPWEQHEQLYTFPSVLSLLLLPVSSFTFSDLLAEVWLLLSDLCLQLTLCNVPFLPRNSSAATQPSDHMSMATLYVVPKTTSGER